MLMTRVITAVVLLAILIAVLVWGGSLGWLIFVSVTLLAGFWEWGRLGGLESKKAMGYGVVGTGLYVALEQAASGSTLVFPVLALSGIFWVGFAPWCLRQVSLGILSNRPLYLVTGFFLLPAAGLALTRAYAEGIVFLLSVVAICWAADIFAYVFGKLFGKHKLAPRVSPGKSWEGALGGTLTVVALSWALVIAASSLPLLEQTWQFKASAQWPPALFTAWLVGLSAISIVGDLFESILKRRANMKDSSHLLPGHGGVLDRIDAQLPVLPLAMLLLGAT